MARLELTLLGPFGALFEGKPITTFESNKVRALLATLAVEAGQAQRREALAALLWPDWPQRSAMNNLSYALSDLRKNIHDKEAQPPFLLITREIIQLNQKSDMWVDAGEFERSVISHQPSAISAQPSADSFQQSEINNLKSAIDLYRGSFLEGFSLSDSAPFEEWLAATRERFNRQMAHALHRLAQFYEQNAEYEHALAFAYRQVALEPWNEEAHQHVMRLLALSGQRSAALAQYETCQRLLAKELGVKPSAETTWLYEAIRDERLSKASEVKGDKASTPVHRLEELMERPHHNLPLQLTSFIGREKEIAEVQAMLRKTPGRLVTLTGSGGVGKTRLTLQAAASLLESFPDGAWLVELAPLTDPARLPSAAAAVLDVHETPGRPASVALRDYLRTKRLLLILDNCEHLAEACAGLAARLLQASPGLHIMATSRERLGVEGETTFHVPSLSIPGAHERMDLKAVSQYEAVRLFIERAQSDSPGFTLTEDNAQVIAQICQRLDGIPLAIELAAARTRLLSVGQIATRLDDAFRLLTGGSRTALPRHQTLRASIDWSYNLLTPQEQSLLRALSIFAGGWTLEAAEAVCADRNVLDGLGQLVDKSLVIAMQRTGSEGTRYRMLETIRQYAGEKLASLGEDGLAHDRHLAYFLQLAERIEPEMHGRHQKARLDQLEEELDNLRLALGWALQTDLEAELRLATAMMWFWLIHTRNLEGLEWLEQGLARLQAPGQQDAPTISQALRVKVLTAAGCMHIRECMFAQAAGELEECLGLYRELGPEGKTGAALTLRWLGSCVWHKGEQSRGIALLREALVLSREVKDTFGIGESLFALGFRLIGRDPGHLEARPLLQESLALLLEIGDPDGIASAYDFMGFLAYYDRELEQAKSMWEQSLFYYKQSGNRISISDVLYCQGVISHLQRDFPTAMEYFRRVMTIQSDAGNPLSLGFPPINMGLFSLIEGNNGLASRCLEEALALCQTAGDQSGIAYSFLYLSKLAWVEGDREGADRKLAQALAANREVDNLYLAAQIMIFQGILALADGDELKAEDCLKEALKTVGNINRIKIDIFMFGPAWALDALAQVKTRWQPERAARMFAAAEHLKWDYLYFLNPVEQSEREKALAQVKAALGEERMAALWAEGQAMTSEAAIAYALEEDGDPPTGSQ